MTADELYGPLEPEPKRNLHLEELMHISMNKKDNYYDDLDHEIYKDVQPDKQKNRSKPLNNSLYMSLHHKHKMK